MEFRFLGQIQSTDPERSWLKTHAAASFAVPRKSNENIIDLFAVRRDELNRSRIMLLAVDLRNPSELLPRSFQGLEHLQDVNATSGDEPILPLGELGAFDENGTSYPCVVENDGDSYLYYTGWMPSVLTPFQNHLGLAIQEKGESRFRKFSRAPILPRTDSDPFSIGASFVMREKGEFKLWYTSFQSWQPSPQGPRHRYWIKSASSRDGIHWERQNETAIGLVDGEDCISHPSVLFENGSYHMWFCSKGEHYKIGHAVSKDGITWQRTKFDPIRSGLDFDSVSQSYPQVFRANGEIYMLYCGNGHGRAGLGLAKMEKKA